MAFFRQSVTKSAEDGVIRRRLIKRNAQKLFEGDFVANLIFQIRIRINMKPLPQQHAFEVYEWIIRIGLFGTFADSVMFKG